MTGLDKLEVTVIPVDDEPYSKIITIPGTMMGKYIQTFCHYDILNLLIKI